MLSEDDVRQRDRAFTQLYDVIDALPPEERQGAILEEAQKVIRNVIGSKAAEDVIKWQQRLVEYQQQMGDPGKLTEKGRQEYDVETRRLENLIRENEQKSQN